MGDGGKCVARVPGEEKVAEREWRAAEVTCLYMSILPVRQSCLGWRKTKPGSNWRRPAKIRDQPDPDWSLHKTN